MTTDDYGRDTARPVPPPWLQFAPLADPDEPAAANGTATPPASPVHTAAPWSGRPPAPPTAGPPPSAAPTPPPITPPPITPPTAPSPHVAHPSPTPPPSAPPPTAAQAAAPHSAVPPPTSMPPQPATAHLYGHAGTQPHPPAPTTPVPHGPPMPQAPPGPQPPPGPGRFPGDHPRGPGLDEVALLRKARRPPARGWRRAVHTLSAGTINPGDSPGDIEYQQLLERVRRPVRGDYRIAVLSLKGGVGKTTTTVGLGSTFATLRGDRVIAVDANPDLGTLAQRIPQQTWSTVRDLLADENVYRYSDVRAHTSQAPSRLEVLASERDPAMAEAFNEDEYRGVLTILQRFYNIIITDCGTGLSHSAMNGVLDLANAIILVSSPALDGARSAGATLDWLQAHGFGHLVSRAVVVLSSSRPGASTIDTGQLAQHFLTRCRAVHQIPFDDHLAEGADIDLDLVSRPTRHALVELAATIADDFGGATAPNAEPFYT
ncbi:MinD/ParA family ATP-binding protein [Gordonia sp. NPDC003429]